MANFIVPNFREHPDDVSIDLVESSAFNHRYIRFLSSTCQASSKTNEPNFAVFWTRRKNARYSVESRCDRDSVGCLNRPRKFRTLIARQNERVDDRRLNLKEDSTRLALFTSRSVVQLASLALRSSCAMCHLFCVFSGTVLWFEPSIHHYTYCSCLDGRDIRNRTLLTRNNASIENFNRNTGVDILNTRRNI